MESDYQIASLLLELDKKLNKLKIKSDKLKIKSTLKLHLCSLN